MYYNCNSLTKSNRRTLESKVRMNPKVVVEGKIFVHGGQTSFPYYPPRDGELTRLRMYINKDNSPKKHLFWSMTV